MFFLGASLGLFRVCLGLVSDFTIFCFVNKGLLKVALSFFGWFGVGLGCIYIVHLGGYLGLRSKKAANSREAERSRSRQAKKQKSKEAEKWERKKSREAQSRIRKKQGNRNQKQMPKKNGKNNSLPEKNSHPFSIVSGSIGLCGVGVS